MPTYGETLFSETSFSKSKIKLSFRNCPVTRGNPTRMLRSAAAVICEGLREENLFCDECIGIDSIKELSFFDNDDLNLIKRGEDMPERNPGKCWVCEQEKNVKNVKGKMCCSNCEFIVRAAYNNASYLLKCLTLIGYQAESKTIHVDNSKKIEELEKEKATMREIIEDQERKREELSQKLVQSELAVKELENIYKISEENVSTLSRKLQELHKENIALAGIVEEAAEEKVPNVSLNRDSILLDMTLGVLNGSVVGIECETIMKLRAC